MKLKNRLAALLALILLLCAPAYAAEDEDPVLFTFNGQEYHQSEVVRNASAYGQAQLISSETAYEEAIEYMIANQLVAEAKAAELGLDQYTDEELAEHGITREEALALSRVEDRKALYEAAGAIRDRFAGRYFDTCSIVNARSGRCSENCKWCAQSAVFKTHVQEYELIDEESCMELARLNAKYGVNKFSFVTSGRSLSNKNIDKLCEYAVKIKQEMKINLCASMGLLTKEQLQRLKEAGITRYHCNLETSRRYFSTLCTSHTTDEKIETIRHALELGMEVCSGGIIGMGETMEDRVDLALTVRELGVKSIPMNVLNPIPGTPLEGAAPLADEEVLTTVAVFRFINPDAFLRFAGGRALIAHIEEDAIRAGINSAIVGDLLTTIGSKVMEDMEKVKRLGFTIEDNL